MKSKANINNEQIKRKRRKKIMKNLKFGFIAIMLIALSFSSIYGQELDEHLKLLEPFINKSWEAEIPRFGEGAKMEIMWKVIEKGKVIKKTGELKILNSTFEAYYFWDSDKQEIGVFSIHNNGNFLHGHVKEEDGKILEYGYVTFPDKKLEFRNTFEFTEDGKLLDKYFRFEDGEWQAGHSREFFEKKE